MPPPAAAPSRNTSQRVKQNVARLGSPGRIPGVDPARGLAILGMDVAQLTVVTPLEWSRSGGGPERTSAAELASDVLGWTYPLVLWLAFVAAGIIAGRISRSARFFGRCRFSATTPHSIGVGEAFGSGGFAPAVLAVSVLAATTSLRRLLRPVRVIGSMPLTAYTAHLLVWGFWSGGTRRVG